MFMLIYLFIYLFIYVFCLKLEKGKEEASWHVVRRCRWDLGAEVVSKLAFYCIGVTLREGRLKYYCI